MTNQPERLPKLTDVSKILQEKFLSQRLIKYLISGVHHEAEAKLHWPRESAADCQPDLLKLIPIESGCKSDAGVDALESDLRWR